MKTQDFSFPKNVLQLGYTTNALGYGVNNAVSKGFIPIFWGGDVRIKQDMSQLPAQYFSFTKSFFV